MLVSNYYYRLFSLSICSFNIGNLMSHDKIVTRCILKEGNVYMVERILLNILSTMSQCKDLIVVAVLLACLFVTKTKHISNYSTLF